MSSLELWGQFRKDQMRRNLSPKTIESRRKRYASFTSWLGAKSPLAATQRDVEGWLDSCRLQARSYNVYLSQLGAFYEWAMRARLIDRDPTADVMKAQTTRLLPRPIPDWDLRLSINLADERMRAWLTLAAYTGLRCYEIRSLRREALLFDHDPPVLFVEHGKGGHQRTVPLAMKTEQALLRYGLPRRGYVFVKSNGRPLTEGSVSRMGNRYLHGLGIESTMHQCRHWFVTRVYQLTGDLRLAQELAGHQDPRTTAGYAAYNLASAALVRTLEVNGNHDMAPLPGLKWDPYVLTHRLAKI